MKALGLVGVGATAISTPVFHDLDELASSDMANPRKPWWIKDRELENPTMEVDWTTIQRYDSSKSAQSNNALYDPNWATVLTQTGTYITDWAKAKKPGYTLKDLAIRTVIGLPPGSTNPWVSTSGFTAPDKLGIPKHEGTPEENSRILRSALRLFGAFMMGYVPLTANTKKLVFSNGFAFEDVEKGYINTKKENVIPNANMTVIPISGLEPLTAYQTTPSALSRGAGHNLGNRIQGQVRSSGSRFLTMLGYDGLDGTVGPIPAFNQLGGGGEICRDGGQVISPTYGVAMASSAITTNLPLTPTPPIDPGIQTFCLTCANCAEVCPSSCLTHDDPSWEVPGGYSNPGHKQFQNEMWKCTSYSNLTNGCNQCMSSCVFTKYEAAGIHGLVKTVLATTPIFNGFFATMDQQFGYGNKQIDPLVGEYNSQAVDWWNWEQAPFNYDQRPFSNTAQ
jgi:reductive dehalogenase